MKGKWKENWQKWAVTISEVIMALAIIWVVMVRTVDIERLPEKFDVLSASVQNLANDAVSNAQFAQAAIIEVKKVDKASKLRDEQLLTTLQTNDATINKISLRLDMALHFIDGLTNHPPIVWPDNTLTQSVQPVVAIKFVNPYE